jgi:hypothetical protein
VQVKYARLVRPGLDGRLIRTLPLMLIWLHPSTARTLTTLRNLKVQNAKESNVTTSAMEKTELGKDWN